MYTLEDDHETSSRFHKHDQAQGVQDAQADDVNDEIAAAVTRPDPPDPAPLPVADGTQRFSASQITASFKQITLPSKSVAAAGNPKRALAALTVACIGVFFTALDQTVVVTALPQVITDLHIPITQLDHAAWIISAYLLGFVVAMPLMGRVSDIYGRRRIFLLCLLIFGVGSVLCGLAPQLGSSIDISFLDALGIDTSSPGLVWLVAARLFQAIGGGAIVPVAMAIAGDFYGQERRGLALGIIGAVTEAGGVLGPLYGAVIVGRFGWQYIFYFNVPVVIALFIAVWLLIPRGKRLRQRIDWLGAVLLAGMLICLSLGLAQQGTSFSSMATQNVPQNNPFVLLLAALFLLAFVLVERKVRWPVVDLSTFKRFTFSASSLVSLFVGAALIIAMTDIPIYVDTVLHGPVLDSGLALLRLTVLIPVGALLGGWLCGRFSCRLVGILGLLFTATGFFLMSRWPIYVDAWQMSISCLTAGLGFGLVIAPISTTAINAVRPSQAGMGSAVVTALRMVGMILGLAVLTSWALSYFRQLASLYHSLPTTATAQQFTAWSKGYAAHLVRSEHTVYTSVFFISMVLCLIAIIPAFFLWNKQAPVTEPLHEMLTEDILAADELELAAAVPAGKWWRNPRRRRRVLIIGSIALVALLIVSGVLAAFMFGGDDSSDSTDSSSTTFVKAGARPTIAATATPIAGPRMLQFALDKTALTSIFVSQLNLQSDILSDLQVVPGPSDAVVLNLNLHIDANGIHRILPVELDGTISIDPQQNLQLTIQHLKRDNLDAGADAAASMQQALNEMLVSTVMPALHGQLKGVKIISAHTSTTIACAQAVEMLVLQIEAPAIQGIAAQPTPVPFCFKGPVDLNKLLPQ